VGREWGGEARERSWEWGWGGNGKQAEKVDGRRGRREGARSRGRKGEL